MTVGEALCDLARAVRLPARDLVIAEPWTTATDVAQVKLALDFDRRPAAFIFRAIVEEWPMPRIVHEMY
ncbi:MAG TPA: hypothetical protein PKE20_09790 [Promineifilum sp.]|nr:hypothetical protein [Promineifilum sp.]